MKKHSQRVNVPHAAKARSVSPFEMEARKKITRTLLDSRLVTTEFLPRLSDLSGIKLCFHNS